MKETKKLQLNEFLKHSLEELEVVPGAACIDLLPGSGFDCQNGNHICQVACANDTHV